jgi:ribonuclease P protein component
MPSIRFPRAARVRAPSDYDRIFKQGRRVALPVLALHWQPQATGSETPVAVDTVPAARLGLAVSRKVDKHAVGRNRIKRVLRDCFRHHRMQLPGGDYVVVARVGASKCSSDELRQAFLGLLRRAGALPVSTAPVTMPPASPPSPPPETASAPRVG